MSMIETWHDIPGFPDYQVSELGNFRRVVRTTITRTVNGGAPEMVSQSIRYRLLRYKPGADGYARISLYETHPVHGDKLPRTVSVHSVVAAVFLGPRPAGGVIRHIDGNKSNNWAKNLEYVTRKDVGGGRPTSFALSHPNSQEKRETKDPLPQ